MRSRPSLPLPARTRQCLCGLLALVFLVGGVAAGQKKGEPAAPGAEFAGAPPATRSWQNPYAGQPDAVLAGRKLYRRHCAECHGENRRGGNDAPDLLSPEVQTAPPGVLFWFLKNGDLKNRMPSWSRLPDERRWQLVSYLQSPGPEKPLAAKE